MRERVPCVRQTHFIFIKFATLGFYFHLERSGGKINIAASVALFFFFVHFSVVTVERLSLLNIFRGNERSRKMIYANTIVPLRHYFN